MSQDLFSGQDLFFWFQAGTAAIQPEVPDSSPDFEDDDPARLEQALAILASRIQHGETLISAQRDSEGVENIRYLRQLQHLQFRYDKLAARLEYLREREPACFLEARDRRTLTAFAELVQMARRGEYDTPGYAEQELLVRSYFLLNPTLADRLLSGDEPV